MDNGWVKIYRILLDKPIWQLSTLEQKVILVTLLLMVNHEEKEWEWEGKKYVCKPGQVITSLKQIKKIAGRGISVQNVRTALTRFEKIHQFLTSESTNRNRLITICNWERYQKRENEADNQTNKQLTSSQQAANKQLTTNKNDKNDKNDKNEKKINIPRLSDEICRFVDGFNEIKKSKFRTTKQLESKFNARLKEGYTVENMLEALKVAMKDKYHIDTAFKYLTPEFFTRSDKLERFMNQKQSDNSGDSDLKKAIMEKFNKKQ
jgi:uncharacterized phage protein (TIGR02220 family)